MNDVGKIKIIRGLSSGERCSRIAFLSIALIILTIGSICLIKAVRWIDRPFPGFLYNQRMLVAGIGQYYWTGTEAGLKFPDKILKADNKMVSTVNDLEEVINNTDVGAPINYIVKRGSQVIERTVPTMRFALADFLMIFGYYVFLGAAYLLIGVVVFILKPDTRTSWAFLLGCFFLSGNYIMTIDIVAIHYGFLGFFFFVQTFLPAAAIHLSLIFPEQKRLIQRQPYLQFVPYIISLIIIIPLEIFYPGPMFVKIYQLVYIYWIVCAIAFLSSIFFSYFKNTSILARQRAKVVLFGASLAFPIPVVANLLFFLGITFWGVQIQNNFFAIPILIFPAFIAYAIGKHNLFDVDVFIKRTVGYIILTIIVGATYFSLQTSLSTFVLRPALGVHAEKVFPIIFALLVVFLFNPVNRRVQGFVDKVFYRKKFDYKETITSVSNTLTTILNQNAIIRQLINTVRREMFVDTAGVVLFDPQKNMCQNLFLDDESDKMKDHTKDVRIGYDDPLLALLTKEKKLITKYDIAEDPRYSNVKEVCKKRFLEMDASLAIPLIYQDEVKGFFALGQKKSGHFYTRDDIDLLETLANQGTVAIENARLFEENLEKVRMEEELKIGHDIQMSMLPKKAPEIEGFEIAAKSIPAREVGGDFYDFIEIRDDKMNDRLAIVIGDVSGKGVAAGLVMAASRSTYRFLADNYPSVEKVMSLGNQRLRSDIKKGMFVALIYAVLSPSERTLTLSNAGQTQPIIYSGGESKPFYIDTEGDKFPQGIVGDCEYLEKQVNLKDGDTVVFYTDGVVEATNESEEIYGFERLMNSIKEGKGLDANALLKKMMDEIERFVGDAKQHDDLTFIVMKVK